MPYPVSACHGRSTPAGAGGSAPVASFTVNTDYLAIFDYAVVNPPGETEFEFTDTSTNSPTSWLWEVRDPRQGTDWNTLTTSQNPTTDVTTLLDACGAGLAGDRVVIPIDVRLTATNAGGSNTKTVTGFVDVYDAGVAERNTAGTDEIFVKSGIYDLHCYGAGGGGAGGTSLDGAGGGGGGGGYAFATIQIEIDDSSLFLTVGAGGTGGAEEASGLAGDYSEVSDVSDTLCRASGGQGGEAGGSGGTFGSYDTGDGGADGGTGATSSHGGDPPFIGGGGGGGAGESSPGGDGSGATGGSGSGLYGGDGGNGGENTVAGDNGLPVGGGGGGGGGGEDAETSSGTGGNGAVGKSRVIGPLGPFGGP